METAIRMLLRDSSLKPRASELSPCRLRISTVERTSRFRQNPAELTDVVGYELQKGRHRRKRYAKGGRLRAVSFMDSERFECEA